MEKNNERGFAAVLVILILGGLIALVGTSYFFGVNKIGKNVNMTKPIISPSPIASQATTGDMANWKTYTNEKYRLEFKYPSDAKTITREPDPFPVIVQVDNFQPDKTVHGFPVGWMMYISEPQSNKNNLSLRQWAKENSLLKDDLVNQKNQTFPKDTKIGGKEAIYWRSTGGDADLLEYLLQTDLGNILFVVNPATGYEETIVQILSTFKFTNSTSSVPKPISDLFNSINTKFNINLVPIEENEFYTTSGMITKKSWKIDFVNTNLGKGLTTFIYSQLTANVLESAGGAGGGVDAYENSQIKCNHIYGFKSGDPTNWKDPFNYLSCTEK